MLQSEREQARLSYLVEFLETMNDGRAVSYPEGSLALEPLAARLMAAYIVTSVEDLAGRLDLGDEPRLEPFELRAGPHLPFWFTFHLLEDLLAELDGSAPLKFARVRAEVDRTLAVPGLRRRLVDRFQSVLDSMTLGSPSDEAGRAARARTLRRELQANRFNQWLGRQDFVLGFDDRALAEVGFGEAGARLAELDLVGTACLYDFGAPAACQSAAGLLKRRYPGADQIIAVRLAEGRRHSGTFGKAAVVFADIHKLVDLDAYARAEKERAERASKAEPRPGRDGAGVMESLFERLDDGIDRACRHSRFREADGLDERVAAGLAALYWQWRLGSPAAQPAAGEAARRRPPAAAGPPLARGNAFVIGSLLKRAIDRKMPIEVALRDGGTSEVHVGTIPFRYDGARLMLAASEPGIGPAQRGAAVSCLMVAAEKDQKFAFYSFESTLLDVTATSSGTPVLVLAAPTDLATKRRKGHRHTPPAALVKQVAVWVRRAVRDDGGAGEAMPEPAIVSMQGKEERLKLLDISSGGVLVEVDLAMTGGFAPQKGQDLCVRLVLDEPRGSRSVDSLLGARVRNVAPSRDRRHLKVGLQFLEQAEARASGALRWRPLPQDGVWDLANWVSQRLLEAGQSRYFVKQGARPEA